MNNQPGDLKYGSPRIAIFWVDPHPPGARAHAHGVGTHGRSADRLRVRDRPILRAPAEHAGGPAGAIAPRSPRSGVGTVTSKLSLDWSPEQVSGWLKAEYPDDESLRVSHETIYRSLFIQARGVLKRQLLGHLRSKRVTRRSRNLNPKAQSRGQIVGAVSIRERPAEVEDRAIPGHWEGDLISGSKNSHIVTLVERQSRFTALIKVPSRDTDTVVSALTRHVRKLPTSLRRSLTWDRGKEMAKHKSFTVATDVKFYFGDPQSPRQRGTNENTNRLLRQYFPKGTDLSRHPQSTLDRVALRPNQRPRETLGFKTPADKLQASVAPTR